MSEDVKRYTVANLNPRSQTSKGMEMTVLRALQLIDAFDALEEGQDWTDVSGATYRKVIGERYEHGMLLSVCYDRWKKGTLHREVLDLYNNLPPAAQEREEIANGIARIREELGGGGKRTPARSPTRGRQRRATHPLR